MRALGKNQRTWGNQSLITTSFKVKIEANPSSITTLMKSFWERKKKEDKNNKQTRVKIKAKSKTSSKWTFVGTVNSSLPKRW
jgi:hypothetical protein